MKILVCFKVVPDLDAMRQEDWVAEDLAVDVSFLPREWNSFDESALETALRLADASGGHQLSAVSIGGSLLNPFFKTLAALKFDEVFRIELDGDLRFSPGRIAALLAAFIRREQFDVVLCGRQSGVGDNAQTPLILTEMLGLPCITQAAEVHPAPENSLRVISRVEGGLLEQRIRPPCILTIGDTQSTYLRIPTLKDRMQYGKRPVTVIDARELEQDSDADSDAGYHAGLSSPRAQPRLVKLEPVDNRRAGVVIDTGTPQEKARLLYERYLQERLS